MKATSESAFWIFTAKDWIEGMNAQVPVKIKAYSLAMACEMLLKYTIVMNGGIPAEAHNPVLLAQEVGKLGGRVPKDIRVYLRTIKEYESKCRYDRTYVVNPKDTDIIIPIMNDWFDMLYREFVTNASNILREKLPPSLASAGTDEELVYSYKDLLE